MFHLKTYDIETQNLIRDSINRYLFSFSTQYWGKEFLTPDGLFKASIQTQIITWSKNLDQPMFKLNTLKTPEIKDISTTM